MDTTSHPEHEKLPLRLREFRQHLKLSQAAFGEKLGLDQTLISAMEKGKSELTVKTLYQLIEMDCNPNWLLLGIGPMQRSAVDNPPATVELRKVQGQTEYILRLNN